MAAQEQATITIKLKAKTQENPKSRMCVKAEKNVNHMISECSELAQQDYKRRHDWFQTNIHCKICRKYRITVKQEWYEHKLETVVKKSKILNFKF